jgi:hypothetical protein
VTGAYIRSNLLCIGGLEFRFPDSISWPGEGPLACYTSFLDRPPVPATDADVINVSMHRGVSAIAGERSGLMDSGDGIIWFKAGDVHVVQKVLPHIASDPLWEIRMHLNDNAAELHFSKTYLEGEASDGGWPVGAPRYQIDQHLVMHFLGARNGALIHSAGIGHQGKGFMCSGVSTAGKTTISRLLVDHGAFEILTDDRVILSCSGEDGVLMHGTPWTGEGQYATSGVAPLAAMFFLKKDKDVRVERLSVADAVARMLPVTSVPWFDAELMDLTLSSLDKVAARVPVYDLYFTKTAETPQFIAELLAETASALG